MGAVLKRKYTEEEILFDGTDKSIDKIKKSLGEGFIVKRIDVGIVIKKNEEFRTGDVIMIKGQWLVVEELQTVSESDIELSKTGKRRARRI